MPARHTCSAWRSGPPRPGASALLPQLVARTSVEGDPSLAGLDASGAAWVLSAEAVASTGVALDLGTVTSLVGAVGLGSVLVQWIAGGKDRRSARAEALAALSALEVARWVSERRSKAAFLEAFRTFEAACLVARLPRRIVTPYLELFIAAYYRRY